ncbi:hypothetical protein [Saccharicrinis aurantiacus]|uniref:hypothetical protein n=1 Tax=Saccharicrinis aurantiacus TaxID=1849719 RepID=UPI000838D2E4|nr:hypothetical protein [Saccharicrinis aurantiacus]
MKDKLNIYAWLITYLLFLISYMAISIGFGISNLYNFLNGLLKLSLLFCFPLAVIIAYNILKPLLTKQTTK